MNELIVLVSFLLVGIIAVGLMMSKQIRTQKINFKYVYFNFVILFIFIVLLIALLFAPGIISFMMRITGFLTPTSLVFTTLLAYLFYNSFLQEIKIAKQKEQIESLSRVISIEKSKNREVK